MKIGIVVSEFNYDITMSMLERAKEQADFLGLEVKDVVAVPGVFDIPLAAKSLLKMDDVDGVVTLGAVLEGETEHDDHIMSQATRKIADLTTEFEKPVALGITGPGMSRPQAEERVERAKDAVESVFKMYKKMKGFK
ncbi:MAG: 6,7-dimethyl-8-ribityllumazine synthase [Thermoplasmata archaeon]|nr:6,7-dimethyl-8-ribityllumazine synthase [Thermoplasmata archaeon]